jgi:hypothetical protein
VASSGPESCAGSTSGDGTGNAHSTSLNSLAMAMIGRIVTIICAIALGASAPAPAQTPKHTVVMLFTPWSAGALRQGFAVASRGKGSCWTQSLSTNRPDAWRCFEGDDILDPCFSGAARSAFVACADDPFSKRVVLLQLTKPLPGDKNPTTAWLQPKGEPWALRLTNGDSCYLVTGATDVVAGLRMNFECKGDGWIIGFPDRSAALWSARTIVWPNKSHVKLANVAMAVF